MQTLASAARASRPIGKAGAACYERAMIVRPLAWRSPLEAFAPLAREPFAALLHAGESARDAGWSILAAFPTEQIVSREGALFVDGARAPDPPFAALRRIAAARSAQVPEAPRGAPFCTGLLGFIGYEMGAALERAGAGPASPFALPDLALGAYDAAAVFDRANHAAFLVGRSAAATDRLAEAIGREAAPDGPIQVDALASNFSADAYRAAVAAITLSIRDGALFQANLSQQLSARGMIDAYAVFRRLMTGDAQYGAYLRHAEGTIVSNSPERFLRVSPSPEGFRILAEPIKGTRPRGRNPAEDAALAAELLADPKERAENIMIADLARNDLSRVCRDGSIREEDICALQTSASVHHLVSRVSGELRGGLGAVDALAALFPCGSISGAPKIEAMRVIGEREGTGRGPYCGAIGYLDDRGAADFSVAIRTLIIERDCATLPVGGGVTLRSDPERERLETLVKAAAMLAALGLDAGAFDLMSGEARAA